jgi:cardiolipin synthase
VGGGLHVIAEESRRLARLLPLSVIEAVASRLAAGDGEDVESLRSQVAHSLPSPHHRGLVVAFFDRWRSDSSEVCPQGAASALLASAMTEREHQHHQSVELVWTGPDVGFVPTRRTEQAILQVLDSATKRITLVSYAVYRIPRVREALVAAAKRGVAITLIVETPNRIEGQGEYDSLLALGKDVASACSVYYWPQENRPKDDNGKIAILHVKCAVADAQWMFLSSANFTEYAFTINMELGLLVTGGKLPGQVEEQFDRLVQSRQLQPLSPHRDEWALQK